MKRHSWLFACLLVAGSGSAAPAQAIHNFEIYLEAPETVVAGETYTIEAYGWADSPEWVEGESGIAGFGIDLINSAGSQGVESISTADVSMQLTGDIGTVEGASLRGVVGGQLAQLFFGLNNDFQFSRPLLLFSVEVQTVEDWTGLIRHAPDNPNENGGLSFYPQWQSGNSIVAPNDSDSSLTLTGVTTRVIPAPATGVLLVLALTPHCRRRR